MLNTYSVVTHWQRPVKGFGLGGGSGKLKDLRILYVFHWLISSSLIITAFRRVMWFNAIPIFNPYQSDRKCLQILREHPLP